MHPINNTIKLSHGRVGGSDNYFFTIFKSIIYCKFKLFRSLKYYLKNILKITHFLRLPTTTFLKPNKERLEHTTKEVLNNFMVHNIN